MSNEIFSGDIALTTQGYLSCSKQKTAVQIKNDHGLALSGHSGSVRLICDSSNSLTIIGACTAHRFNTNIIGTRTAVNLTLSPQGPGIAVEPGKHLSLGGNPATRYTLDILGTPKTDSIESLTRWSTTEAVQHDYLEIANGTAGGQTFVPSINSVQRSNPAFATLRIYGSTNRNCDIKGDASAIAFGATLVDGGPLVNRTLFQWRNGSSPRGTSSVMELLPDNGYANLLIPNALNQKIKISGSSGDFSTVGKISCSQLTITSQSNENIVTILGNHGAFIKIDSNARIDCNNQPIKNFCIEPIAVLPQPGNVGRLIWDSTNSLLKIDTGTSFNIVGPTNYRQIFQSTADSNTISGKESALTPFDQLTILQARTVRPGDKLTISISGRINRFSNTSIALLGMIGNSIWHNDVSQIFNNSGGNCINAGWQIDCDIICRKIGEESLCITSSNCILPLKKGVTQTETPTTINDYRIFRDTLIFDGTIDNSIILFCQWGAGTNERDEITIENFSVALIRT